MATFDNSKQLLIANYPDFKFDIGHDESDIFINLSSLISKNDKDTLFKICQFIVFAMKRKNKKFEVVAWATLLTYAQKKEGSVTFDELITAVYKIAEHFYDNKERYPIIFDKQYDYHHALINMDAIAPKVVEELNLIEQ